MVFDSLGRSHTSCCLLVLVRPSKREVGWCLATTESKLGVTLCPVRSVQTEGERNLETILCHDLHTCLAAACCGVGSFCSTGNIISSDCVNVEPVEYSVRAALTRVDDRQIVSKIEETLGKDMLGR